MNYIAAFLLLFMNEEEAFWMLTTIVEDIMTDYYSKDMSGLQVCACVCMRVRVCMCVRACACVCICVSFSCCVGLFANSCKWW